MKYNTIIFDCDSTLSTIEGIDELATTPELKTKLKKLTDLAMAGEMNFTEVMMKRFKIINPSKEELIKLGEKYIQNVFPGAQNLIKALRKQKTEILIISGGFKTAILPFAKFLGIESENIFANNIIFDNQGKFKALNLDNPLVQPNGKVIILNNWKRQNPQKKVAFIGDGITDLVTQPLVDRFIGFGGVIVRKNVQEHARIFFKGNNMKHLLPLLTRPLHATQ
jgi:phosphoserine phosphatase